MTALEYRTIPRSQMKAIADEWQQSGRYKAAFLEFCSDMWNEVVDEKVAAGVRKSFTEAHQ